MVRKPIWNCGGVKFEPTSFFGVGASGGPHWLWFQSIEDSPEAYELKHLVHHLDQAEARQRSLLSSTALVVIEHQNTLLLFPSKPSFLGLVDHRVSSSSAFLIRPAVLKWAKAQKDSKNRAKAFLPREAGVGETQSDRERDRHCSLHVHLPPQFRGFVDRWSALRQALLTEHGRSSLPVQVAPCSVSYCPREAL